MMIKNIFLTLTLVFTGLAVNAQNVTATQILNQIHADYAKRFDSAGRYIDDQKLTDQFKNSQLQAIQILRQNKMIGQSFQIQNSAMADLVVTVSIVQEKNLDFAGLLVERGGVFDPELPFELHKRADIGSSVAAPRIMVSSRPRACSRRSVNT